MRCDTAAGLLTHIRRTGSSGRGSCVAMKYGVGQEFANEEAAKEAAEAWVAARLAEMA